MAFVSPTPRVTTPPGTISRGNPSCKLRNLPRPVLNGRALARKNDPASIRPRQEILGVDGLVTSIDLSRSRARRRRCRGRRDPGLRLPGHDRAGAYELDDDGALVETGRDAEDAPRAARAHRGQHDALDDPRLDRGRRDATTCSPTGSRGRRASSAPTLRRAGARALDRAELPAMHAVARGARTTRGCRGTRGCERSKTHVVGPMCHVLWALDDRRRGRAEHDDAQRLRAEHGRTCCRGAGQARACDPRGEHGRRQEALVRVLPVRAREDGDRRGVPRRRADRARAPHDRSRPRGALLGGHARRGRVGHAVGRVHARDRDRRRLRRDGPGSRAWSAPRRWRTARRAGSRAGCTRRSASPGSRSARSAAARRSRPRATGSRSIGCAGPGKVYRFAQIVAAAALASRSAPRPHGDGGQRELLPGAPRARRAAYDRARVQLRHRGHRRVRAHPRPGGRVGRVLPRRQRLRRHRAAARRRDPAATSSSTAGSRARPTTRSSPRTATSTCGASTRRAFHHDAASCGSGRSRASGSARGPTLLRPSCTASGR